MGSQTVRDEAVVGIGRTRRRKQSGYVTLIGMFLALAAAAAAMPWVFEKQQRDREQELANTAGKDLAMIASGVSEYVSKVQSGDEPPNEGDDLTLTLGDLRPEQCGGPDRGYFEPHEGFIPCQVADYGDSDTPFWDEYEIRIEHLNSPGGGAAGNASLVQAFVNTQVDPGKDFAGRQARVAQRITNVANEHREPGGHEMFNAVFANVDVDDVETPTNPSDEYTTPTPNFDDPTASSFGRVVMVVSNRSTADRWLRVDGTNEMEADINAGGYDLRDAENIDAAGDLLLGGDALIGGDSQVGGSSLVRESLTVGDDIEAGGDITGEDVAARNDMIAGNDVLASNDVWAGGDVETEGDVLADGEVLAEDVYMDNVQLHASQAFYEGHVVGRGERVPYPRSDEGGCPSGRSEAIFTSIQDVVVDDGQTDSAIYGQRVDVGRSGNEWTVDVEVLTDDSGWVRARDWNVVAMTQCR